MIIQADKIWTRLGRVDALRGASLVVPPGSAYALIGPNGAGKTTLIRVLMNIVGSCRGTASVLGVDTRSLSPRELARIGYVSENQEMPSRLTVGQFIDYLRPFYPSWDPALEAEMRDRFKLPSERRIGDLSHGMRMKLALLCALSFRPKVLILDEPFSGLDPLTRDEFMTGLLGQADEMTMLISSHELDEIEGIATHVGYLDQGRMLFQEPVDDLAARVRQVHVTLRGEASVPSHAPQEWLDVRAAGSVLSFVETGYSQEAFHRRVASVLEGIERVDAQPIPLRSIFTTLARNAPAPGKPI